MTRPHIAGTVIAILLVTVLLQAECTTQGAGQVESSPPLLLISIDGFLPEYLDRNHTPNLDRLVEGGVLAESMITAFPTKTFPTHYSIVTGLYVENHGVISNQFFDADFEYRFRFGPPANAPDDIVWWGGEPIWVTAENQGVVAATMFWPGSDSEIAGVRPTRYKDYDGSVPNHARVDTVISWLDPAGDVQGGFGTLYYSDVDVSGHRYGPDSEEVDRAVEEADEWIGYLLERIEETGFTEGLNLMIVSDHGMAELSEERLIFLDDLIDMDAVRVVDRTPVAMLQPDEGRSEEIYKALREQKENYVVYRKEEMPESYRFQNHPRIPDIIMIADSGYMIMTHAIFGSSGIPAGMHGYDPRVPEMHAFFLVNGPSFNRNQKIGSFQSIHLYELMSYLLDIEPATNDGKLDSLEHIIP